MMNANFKKLLIKKEIIFVYRILHKFAVDLNVCYTQRKTTIILIYFGN